MYSLKDVAIFISTIFVTTLLMRLWTRKRKVNNRPYPPSLPSLPLVGSLPFMWGFDKLEKHFVELADKHGPIFTLKLANRLCLVLTTREVIEEALVKHSPAFSGRESYYCERASNPNRKGILSRDFTLEFKRYQQLSLSVLKEFGLGINSLMESRILAELECLNSFIRTKNGQKFDPKEMMAQFSFNIINNILLGKRDDYNGLSEIIRLISALGSNVTFAIDIAPNIFRFIPYFRQKLSAYVDSVIAINKILLGEIQRIKEHIGLECFVSRYLAKAGPDCDQEQLLYTVRDLVGAGTETTASTLLWLMVFAANHRAVQERLQREIDSVIPGDTLPSLDDQSKLPYVEATILEMMRLRTILPLSVPRLTIADVEMSGYFIPKGTVVIPVIYGAHMDPKTWIDPEVFRPERFLDEDIHVIGRDRVIPFSLGRRSCFGEVLARQELFLSFVWLIQQFDILPPLNQQRITVHTIGDAVHSPGPFEIRLVSREK